MRSVQLAANGTAIVSQTQSYDAVVSLNGYGDVLETTSSNALGHTTKQRTDVGWPLLAVDVVTRDLLMEDALRAEVGLSDDSRLLKETGRSAHPTAMRILKSCDAHSFRGPASERKGTRLCLASR